jgi:hypothetical protein
MSTLNVSNITDGTDTVETGYVLNGSAKAYVRADGDAVIQESQSFNVASSTDHGTGDYSHSLTNDLDTRGVQISSPRRNSQGQATCMNETRDGVGIMAIRHYNNSASLSNGRHTIVLFGDLA